VDWNVVAAGARRTIRLDSSSDLVVLEEAQEKEH